MKCLQGRRYSNVREAVFQIDAPVHVDPLCIHRRLDTERSYHLEGFGPNLICKSVHCMVIRKDESILRPECTARFFKVGKSSLVVSTRFSSIFPCSRIHFSTAGSIIWTPMLCALAAAVKIDVSGYSGS